MHYTHVLQASGSSSLTVLHIMIMAKDLDDAKAQGAKIIPSLFPNYFNFNLFNDEGQMGVLHRYKVTAQAPVVE